MFGTCCATAFTVTLVAALTLNTNPNTNPNPNPNPDHIPNPNQNYNPNSNQVTLVAASPLLGRLVTVALLADTLLMVPEWLGPVVRISLGWFGREVSHVGESVQGQRLLTAVRHGVGLGGLGLAKPLQAQAQS